MSYGMHHYLMEKAAQQEGMRKEAGAMSTVGKGIVNGVDSAAKFLGKAVGNPFRRLGGKMYNKGVQNTFPDASLEDLVDAGLDTANLGRVGNAGRFMSNHSKALDAATGATAGAGIIGGGAYGINKALEKDSYLDKALELLNQYKGTAAGVSTGIPTAIAAAAMSKPGSRLKNALLYGAIASIIGGGAGYAYDRYNA